MEIIYGDLVVTGEFALKNIRELGFDRDFLLEADRRVLLLEGLGLPLQFPTIARILLRASLSVPEVTCHLLSDTDIGSAVANFTFPASRYSVSLTNRGSQSVLSLVPRS